MSLGNWEGKSCIETEPEELPEMLTEVYCEGQEAGDWISAPFCQKQKGVFFLPKIKRLK